MITPGTEFGRWSLGLLVAFAAGLSLFSLAVAAGHRGGDDLFDNMWLTGPMLFAVGAAAGAAVSGLVAMIGQGERAVSVLVAIVVGSLVTIFGVMEVAFPH